MPAPRLAVLIAMVFLSLACPAQAQPPGGGGSPGGGAGFPGGGGGFPGGGGGGGRRFGGGDPNQFFDRLANGKEVLTRADITNPFMQRMFDNIASQAGVTNGQLTREQFVNAMQQFRNQGGGFGRGGQGNAPGGGNGFNDPNAQANWAENMFRRLDQNGDGYLNNDEMPEALRIERDKWDTDRNGLIDLNEFKSYFQARIQQFQQERGNQADPNLSPDLGLLPMPAAPPPEEEERKPVVYRAGQLPKELPSWFQQIDADGDAQIGLYEWKASGRPIEEFLKMDRNRDGFLTVDEVLYYTAKNKPATPGNRPGGGFGNFAANGGGNGPPGMGGGFGNGRFGGSGAGNRRGNNRQRSE